MPKKKLSTTPTHTDTVVCTFGEFKQILLVPVAQLCQNPFEITTLRKSFLERLVMLGFTPEVGDAVCMGYYVS